MEGWNEDKEDKIGDIYKGKTDPGRWKRIPELIDKEWVQKPQARKLSVGGVPPPRGLHGREFSEKLAEKS